MSEYGPFAKLKLKPLIWEPYEDDRTDMPKRWRAIVAGGHFEMRAYPYGFDVALVTEFAEPGVVYVKEGLPDIETAEREANEGYHAYFLGFMEPMS